MLQLIEKDPCPAWEDALSFSYYNSITNLIPDKEISWNSLVNLVKNPFKKIKNEAPLITPFLANGKSKGHTQEAPYHAIAIDFDDVDYSVKKGIEQVKAIYSGTFLYFTTANHSINESTTALKDSTKPIKGTRFKVIIPLEAPLNCSSYVDLSKGISLLFDADPAQARATQGFYAPNTLNKSIYQGEMIEGDNSRLNADSALYKQAMTLLAEQAQSSLFYSDRKHNSDTLLKQATLKPKPSLSSNNNIIQLINDAYSLEGLLVKHGYIKQGKCWLAPSSSSGMAGVHILEDNRIYSHHSNDVLGAINNDGHSLDLSDVLCILEYKGNFSQMVKEQAARLDPEGQKERQQAFKAEQSKKASNDPHYSALDFDNSPPYNLFGNFPLPDMNMEFVPSVIAEYATDQGELIGADPATLVIFSLSAMAACITDELKIQPKEYDYSWTENARVWAAVIGSPSIKKSPMLNKATAPLKSIDKKWRAESKKQLHTWTKQLEKAKEDNTIAPEKPLEKRLILEDVTIEKMGDILSKAEPRGVLILRDELSGWLGSMDAYKGGAQKDKPAWLEAYNGGYKSFDRISRGETFVENWSASIVGGIQPSIIHAYAKATEHDGMLQRFILFYAKEHKDTGQDRLPNAKAQRAYKDLIDHLAALGGSNNPITLSKGAQDERKTLDDKVHRLKNNHQSNHIQAALGKWSGLYARLLLIWHCCEVASENTYPTNIPVTQSTANKVARFMWENLLPHLLKFYGDLDPLEDTSQKLASLILDKEWERFTPKRDFNQHWKASRSLKPWEIKAALERLEGFNWIIPEKQSFNTDGIASAYAVNPRIHKLFTEQKEKERTRRAEVTAAMAELSIQYN